MNIYGLPGPRNICTHIAHCFMNRSQKKNVRNKGYIAYNAKPNGREAVQDDSKSNIKYRNDPSIIPFALFN